MQNKNCADCGGRLEADNGRQGQEYKCVDLPAQRGEEDGGDGGEGAVGHHHVSGGHQGDGEDTGGE